jgi:hypothetical protein
MSELVINGLARKRADLAGEIEHTQARLRTLVADVGSLDAAIRVFNPDYKVQAIKSKAFRPSREGIKRGEVSRAILDILRQASAALTTRQVAERVTPGADARVMKRTVKRVGLALSRQRQQLAVGQRTEQVLDGLQRGAVFQAVPGEERLGGVDDHHGMLTRADESEGGDP